MRRLVILICLGLLAVPGVVLAKPRVAVAPLENDAGGKVKAAIAEALDDDAKLVGAKDVRRTMDQLGLSGELDAKGAKQLRTQLDAVAVVSGSVEKDGKQRNVQLVVFVKGKKKGSKISVSFKNAPTAKFRKEVRAEVMKRVGDQEDDEDEVAAKKEKEREKREKEKRAKEEREREEQAEREKSEKEKKKKKKKVAEASEEEGEGDGEVKKKKKRKKRRSADGEEIEAEVEVEPGAPRARHAVTEAAIRVDLGGSFGLRQLSYQATMAPPKVSTGSAGGRLEAELYPFAFDEVRGPAAGIGLVGDYDRTFGLSIQAPGTATRVPIEKSHYSVGARYRVVVGGGTTIGFGAAFAKRRYAADRTAGMLDMPDVDYSAVAPRVALRVPVAKSAAMFLDGGALLMLGTGPIQKGDSFGRADVFGFEARGGADVALGKGYGLRLLAELNQINFTFKGTGAVSSARGVTNATDRTIGLAAMFMVLY